ncbi:hypothetical protein [Azorhizobium sp. AG788]|uniref:hypothetical protein n=1 Tax=Azorhizobium sp. AG788 TaxID=2183897 RepID=UPI00105CEAFD|nr:hypothetical protein [Azorhizobium sp. AG788]
MDIASFGFVSDVAAPIARRHEDPVGGGVASLFSLALESAYHSDPFRFHVMQVTRELVEQFRQALFRPRAFKLAQLHFDRQGHSFQGPVYAHYGQSCGTEAGGVGVVRWVLPTCDQKPKCEDQQKSVQNESQNAGSPKLPESLVQSIGHSENHHLTQFHDRPEDLADRDGCAGGIARSLHDGSSINICLPWTIAVKGVGTCCKSRMTGMTSISASYVPRAPGASTVNSGSSSADGRMRAKPSSVSGGLSGSAAAMAVMAASSASVISANCFSALARASAHVLDRLGIAWSSPAAVRAGAAE